MESYGFYLMNHDYSAKRNNPQPAAWIPRIRHNPIRRRKHCNAPSACGGNRNFQGFAFLLTTIAPLASSKAASVLPS